MQGLMFPKPKKRIKRKRHPPSILPTQKGICLICARNGDYRKKETEEHHVVFGSGGRALSEEYGLKCNLCIEHHRTGPDAVHESRQAREYLCEIFQEEFEKTHTHEEWMAIAGKNYL